MLLFLLACVAAPATDAPARGAADTAIEPLPGDTSAPPDTDDDPALVFDPTGVHTIALTVSEAALASLRASPTTQVGADLEFNGEALPGVGLRVKGSASFQPIDQKPGLKIELDYTEPGVRLHGLERLTLNNEVWDPTMMAETMAYATFRGNGAPAPRTGYASVTLNGRLLGVYTILEAMDDHFVDANWPNSEGGLWEMTVGCDFTGDCSCFDPQTIGDRFDPAGISVGCEAVAQSDLAEIQEAFDWEPLISFLAVQIAVNHPDSYSYNLNNYFVFQHPDTAQLTLTPWGADSTFIYAYPVNTPNPDCEPLYLAVDDTQPVGALARLCANRSACADALAARLGEIADWMEAEDLVGQMAATRDLLDPHAPNETWVNWTLVDRNARVACFLDWTERRPAELRAWPP